MIAINFHTAAMTMINIDRGDWVSLSRREWEKGEWEESGLQPSLFLE